MKIILTLLISIISFSIQANEFKHWKISSGAYVVGDYKAKISALGSDGSFAGISLPDLLDMETETLSFYLDGYYKFNDKHRLEFGYKSVENLGDVFYNGIIFEGTPIEKTVNGQISSFINNESIKLEYAYSFYKADIIELMIAAGFHRTTLEVGIKEDGILFTEGSFKFAQPLPVIGFRLNYELATKWDLFFIYDLFGLSANLEIEDNPGIESFKGAFTDLTIATEYEINKLFSLGLSVNMINYDVTLILDDTSDLRIENEIVGVSIFGSFYF